MRDTIELTKIHPQTDTLVLTITPVLVCAKHLAAGKDIVGRLSIGPQFGPSLR